MKRSSISIALQCIIGITLSKSALAQEAVEGRAAVLATVEAALEAISREDMIAFTDLMIDQAVMFRIAERGREFRYSVLTRAESRANNPSDDIVERGFEPEIRISGPLAVAWVPYDLYVNGEWSHCGVDAFTLVRIEGEWKIAALAWSVEQPPACQ